ncbi:hypothetical protein G1K75_12075 [Tenacibaculum finnmarkense]|uniref:plasmid mobilization relaxosome protein MobC n=1 Tax=Tenacibaculum finnmarkense TaxID=2781243 RepID=UPI00187BB064|nr:hypothetical protein [Tenacibaculum finnmarkense]MCD8415963.1 hypothetical protein [Tenacibaculum dicentrarchi]MBE7634983.1 hypothetical protein [Tenacibaculum finnmarkense genomovar ulcerans]MBE7649031.1 hypothetical protein [Tenacibaculum finnmarkense genomovar ulcerans]MCD8401354.1 hypothetical protein [Tenacibaculum finnmarkense genomovar ulcerans]MCD8403798.1 hypothetical protein [Tenacibaculum finnmarkense genomovar finnmarkense]
MNHSPKKGRPEIKEHLKRSLTINLKVNTSEKKYIDTLLSENEYYKDRNTMLRDIVINGEYVVRELKEDRLKLIELQDLKKELHGIGLNFNQIVKHINTKKLNYFTQEDKKNTANSLIELNKSLSNIHYFLNNLD